MIRLDPKPGTIFLTRDAEFESKSYYAFIKAGGKIQSNGYRITISKDANAAQNQEVADDLS